MEELVFKTLLYCGRKTFSQDQQLVALSADAVSLPCWGRVTVSTAAVVYLRLNSESHCAGADKQKVASAGI